MNIDDRVDKLEQKLKKLENKFQWHNHDNAVERIRKLEQILSFFQNWIASIGEE
jgi:hypothetical protein